MMVFEKDVFVDMLIAHLEELNEKEENSTW